VRPLLRDILQSGFSWLMVPIRSGPLKGRKWAVATSTKYIRGTYEAGDVQVFRETVREGSVVYDVGAHMGYYSVLASDLVGPSGSVVAFEPLPLNLRHLRRHLKVNGCGNVTVVDACVGERSGESGFQPGAGSGRGHMADDGPMLVPMVSLDAFSAEGDVPAPACIKIDVEGAEYSVLKGAESVIDTARPTILLSIHGNEVRRQCIDFLVKHGYRLQPMGDRRLSEALSILATPGD
jgi:FkbM family methyltransferase